MRCLFHLCAALAFLWAGACTGEFESRNGSDLSPNPGQADAGAPGANGAAFFQQNILPMMSIPRAKGACAICHQGADAANGPDFLGMNAETNYATLLASPGLVGATPAASSLYSRGDHGGDAFLPAEAATVAMWIAMEQ